MLLSGLKNVPTIKVQSEINEINGYKFRIKHMFKLTIFGHSLTLAGLKKSLPLADLHNNRRISAENGAYGDIDPFRSHLNVHLVSSGALSYVDAVKKHLTQAGLDLDHYRY